MTPINRTILYSFFLVYFGLPGYGQAVLRTQEEKAQIRKLLHSIEKNPNRIETHVKFIQLFDINNPGLINQYDAWIKRFPDNAIIPFAIGKVFEQYKDARCKKYLSIAVNVNPKMAVAWEYLSYYSSITGNNESAINYMRKATECDARNANTAFFYAYLHKDGDQIKYDSLMLNVSYNYPRSESGEKALYFLATQPFNKNMCISYYEALYSGFWLKDSSWFRAGMLEYYDYLFENSPEKAFELSLKMVLNTKHNRQDWKQRNMVARNLVEAKDCMLHNKPDSAFKLIEKINLSDHIMGSAIAGGEKLALLKAEALAASNRLKTAFDCLSDYYSKSPSDKTRSALLFYGNKMGMDSNKVDSNIWQLRTKAAWKETNFTLKSYADEKDVSLSDYKGKVVLVTYWFPTCGACRAEFPYFESVLKGFNSEQVAYLGINVDSKEDDYVGSFVKSNNYSFVPLKRVANQNIGNLPEVNFAPTNFLIDQSGRVIFKDFQINEKNEDTLRLMINDLLKMGGSKKL